MLLCDSLRSNGFAVVPKHPEDALHQSALSISGSLTVEEEHTLIPGVTADAVAECLLQELRPIGILAHDLIDERLKAFIPCPRVVGDRTDLCDEVIRGMGSDRSSSKVDGHIVAVEQINIGIKPLHRHRVDTLCLLDVGLPPPSLLPVLGVIEEQLTQCLVPDGRSIDEQCIRQVFAKFHDRQCGNIGHPTFPVIDEPLLTLRHEPCNVLEHIGKEPTVSDVIVSVTLIIDQIEFRQFQHDVIEVICCRSNDWGVECCAVPHHFLQCENAVGRATL